ncbi:hypothetical protein Pmar_PMAR004362 [Perkinsus marinus ATCC 50983]|uniref:GH18 domain-containing protein n=1 Tax=Perkinsus marinus (strain ATCC 50983 / TXsc) TaxID=423536 RepID=C5KAG6_PERM5|nr:hypothetical protein Pmar_PMAR004362 [Perkinsus marinus ATCC 50983]EER18502.1 hypothetical protein Pmar_PMAR004362 [Perkinsus marinus ATCC 50983]|eukprot:XP_002786706.1 hypothetical protein Pmar_PMAR004362 [Perkinsus marinus ATCC 50983]
MLAAIILSLVLDFSSPVYADRQHTVRAFAMFPSRMSLNDYTSMLEAGANTLILGISVAKANGEVVLVDGINATIMSDIHTLAKQYDAEVLLGVSPIFKEGEDIKQFDRGFAASVEKYFEEFYSDGFVVVPFSDSTYVEVVRSMGDTIRSRRTWKDDRGTAVLMFQSVGYWPFIEAVGVPAYFDTAICTLETDPAVTNTIKWAEESLHKWDNITRTPGDLEFGVIPEGRKKPSLDALAYRELIDMGAPSDGVGLFDGYYYDSQRQIREKANLVLSMNMQGITFFAIESDLPASDNRSLLVAAVGAFRPQ